MTKAFYGNLAINNIRKNSKGYIPYMLTCMLCIMIFYIMLAIAGHSGIQEMFGGAVLSSILNFGCGVVGIFSAIFLFYTNSILIKQRKKELALYNILGMAKRHIGRMMFFETLFTSALSLVTGLLSGMIFGKLVFLILLKITGISVPIEYELSLSAAGTCCVLFGLIFLSVLICNLGRVTISNPMELLGGSQQGEKEPKAKWFLSLLGLIFLGIGYYLAINVSSPLQALLIFFIAVILVILGTYLLFTTGSIALLKLLKKNKKFYYKTEHFTAVSGMLYRMKRNAAGLASICILSTMVLVTISTVISMQTGIGSAVDENYANDLIVRKYAASENQQKKLSEMTGEILETNHVTAKETIAYPFLEYSAQMQGSRAVSAGYDQWDGDMSTLYFIPIQDSGMQEKYGRLQQDEIIVGGKMPYEHDTLEIGEKTFHVLQRNSDFISSPAAGIMTDYFFVLVSDQQVLDQLAVQLQKEDSIPASQGYYIGVDLLEGQNKQMEHAVAEITKQAGDETRVIYKKTMREEIYSLYGGLFFIGIFLGLLFLMATVLIIYYKQISEGYEDQQRYQIMQKVGMSLKEVKASIRSQILIVFFLPLLVAVCHVAGAFNMMSKLLIALSLPDIGLFILCTVGTILVFVVIYILVYSLTAREYYKLVK